MKVDTAWVKQQYGYCRDLAEIIRRTVQDLDTQYRNAGTGWNDGHYRMLGTIVEECRHSLLSTAAQIGDVLCKLDQMTAAINEYNEVNLSGSGGGGSPGSGTSGTGSSVSSGASGSGNSAMPAIHISQFTTVAAVSEWLGNVNPNYDPFDSFKSAYRKNCGSCAYAVFRRMQGDTGICASSQNIPGISQMESLTGMHQTPMSPQEIEQRLLAAGNGAHAIIGIDRRGDDPGHWFNAACLDGRVVAIDGQTNEILDWPPDYGDIINWDMSI